MGEMSIYSTVQSIIGYLENSKNESEVKATLSGLRSFNTKNPNDISSLSFVFSRIPPEKLGKKEQLNNYEDVVAFTLKLYAIYKQGISNDIAEIKDTYKSFGKSLNEIRTEESLSLDRNANILFMSSDYEKLKKRLVQLIKLLRAKGNGTVKINFAKLAKDLYDFSFGNDDIVKISWARDYYRYKKEENKEN